ncbi:MAG TPA: S41 family peptidase [Cyclobacteriaceae bacterium]|nr:S41 family peptidase [Cyclobacteriaceae bacterium]HPW61050.1 S41 family peptidase [Cyclobacteriaceae bacterium]
MEEQKNTSYQISLPLILCIGLAAGVLIGASLTNKTGSGDISNDVQKFREVLSLVKNEYVDEAETDVLVEDAIEHMLGKLDPHSSYLSAKDQVAANEDLRGNFEGIGIEYNIFHDTLVVVSALSGGPSESVGLRSGDKIVKVNETNIASIGLSIPDVQRYLKGPKGTEVKIEVIRKNVKEPITFTIIRDKIPQFSVDASYMVTPDVGYIKVNRFSQTTHSEVKDAVSKLKKEGMTKLILDLQGNGGGYLDQAVGIADEFLVKGEKIVFTKGQEMKYNEDHFATTQGDFEQGDLIVLVNESSASASEIVAGALQDNDRALIVGRRSYGKGLVQRPFSLNDGSEVRLTISRYYTPSGRSIQKPYDDLDEYDKDITKRYKHGEFFSADSIRFNDSLKYETQNGRSVYGGGGIMPDYFVPLDTTSSSKYFNELFNANILREYAFMFAEQNESQLKEKGYRAYLQNFEVNDAMLSRVVVMGIKNKIEARPNDLAKNKRLFKVYLKAEIARNVWDNQSFYPIINETNEVLQQAIKLFDRIPELNRSKM